MPGPRRPQIFGAGLGVPECEITLQWWRALQELQRKTSYKHDQTYWLFSFICLIFVRPQEVLLLELQGFEWFSITLHARVCANLGIQTRLHVQGRLFNRRGEPVVVGRWQFEKAQVGKQVCWDVKSLRGKKMLERSWVSLFRPIKYHIYIHTYLGHRYERLNILNKITKIDEDPNRFWQCNAKRPSLFALRWLLRLLKQSSTPGASGPKWLV